MEDRLLCSGRGRRRKHQRGTIKI